MYWNTSRKTKLFSQLADRALAKDGFLVIYVPAFQILFSKMDEKVGHYRRYSKKRLISALQGSGLEIVRCEYVDSIGFFASLILKVLKLGSGAATNGVILKMYDGLVFPLSRILDKIGMKHLFGKNILLIAQKSKSQTTST